MKSLLLAATIVLAAFTVNPASAKISADALNTAINAAVTNGTLNTVVHKDIVIIYGQVEGIYDAVKAQNAAKKVSGVNTVINRIVTSN